jgi:hypothetical protein
MILDGRVRIDIKKGGVAGHNYEFSHQCREGGLGGKRYHRGVGGGAIIQTKYYRGWFEPDLLEMLYYRQVERLFISSQETAGLSTLFS